ncbi:hypothetical protein SAMN05216167_1528 [Spirosoma endophyticum]|uniref:Uncharacterized protein n=1 Tax=Spirosoma endophyticum TaxID=662367 RepID=A0A1I2HYT4_9BACT|nr:hypothetical protein SAMN05216167_1528 [Spirosoma endophyticum]
MEGVSDQLPDQPAPEKLRFNAANDFLTICDGNGRPAVVYGLRQRLLLGRCAARFAHCRRPGKVAATADRLIRLRIGLLVS